MQDTIRTVYLCDDGKDPTKEEMIRELNAEYGCLEYVSGRKRDPNGMQWEAVPQSCLEPDTLSQQQRCWQLGRWSVQQQITAP